MDAAFKAKLAKVDQVLNCKRKEWISKHALISKNPVVNLANRLDLTGLTPYQISIYSGLCKATVKRVLDLKVKVIYHSTFTMLDNVCKQYKV